MSAPPWSLTIPGNPGAAAINAAKRAGVTKRGRLYVRPSTKAKSWRDLAALLVRRSLADRVAFDPPFPTGPVRVVVRAYWPRVIRTGAADGLPLGDVDAVVKATLDVLRDRVFADDSQVMAATLEKHHDAKAPRIEVEVWPV